MTGAAHVTSTEGQVCHDGTHLTQPEHLSVAEAQERLGNFGKPVVLSCPSAVFTPMLVSTPLSV